MGSIGNNLGSASAVLEAFMRPDKRDNRSIPRGKIIGKRIDGLPAKESEHFFKCAACGGWVDMRDLGMVLDHEAPLPHPASDQPR